jgi:hypothetical protein
MTQRPIYMDNHAMTPMDPQLMALRRQLYEGITRELSPLYEMAKEGIDLKSVQWKHIRGVQLRLRVTHKGST